MAKDGKRKEEKRKKESRDEDPSSAVASTSAAGTSESRKRGHSSERPDEQRDKKKKKRDKRDASPLPSTSRRSRTPEREPKRKSSSSGRHPSKSSGRRSSDEESRSRSPTPEKRKKVAPLKVKLPASAAATKKRGEFAFFFFIFSVAWVRYFRGPRYLILDGVWRGGGNQSPLRVLPSILINSFFVSLEEKLPPPLPEPFPAHEFPVPGAKGGLCMLNLKKGRTYKYTSKDTKRRGGASVLAKEDGGAEDPSEERGEDAGVPINVNIAAAALIGRALDIRAGATRTVKGQKDALRALYAQLYRKQPSEKVVEAFYKAKERQWLKKAAAGRMFVTGGSTSHYQAPLQHVDTALLTAVAVEEKIRDAIRVHLSGFLLYLTGKFVPRYFFFARKKVARY